MTEDPRPPAGGEGAAGEPGDEPATRRLPVMEPVVPPGGMPAGPPTVRLPAGPASAASAPAGPGSPARVPAQQGPGVPAGSGVAAGWVVPGGTEPVIDLVDGTKTYETGAASVQALRGVTLRVDRGEYVAIMGPSGSGKSTLMHILGCLDVLTTGTYHLSGQDVSAMSEAELAEVRNRRIGFVFQQFNLLASLPAWRNVELPLVYAGVDRRLRRERALRALERVGLADRVEHRPGELSGGQQQRVAVARALVTDPDLVLADEPTGNLDSASTEEILGLLGDVHAQGRTVVLITHEAEVAAAARRTVRMRDGLVQDDTATLAGGAR